jgi:UDP:flavonoid glycosyltransferase YjiC (YdhE family)
MYLIQTIGTCWIKKFQMQRVKIVIATIFQNGGDATRAIEIAKIIKEYEPENYDAEIIFISRGSKFENVAERLDFKIFKTTPKMKGLKFQDDFKTKFGDLIGDKNLAIEILKGEIDAYKKLQPDILLCGFWPIGSIARKIAIPDVKTIAFLPLPLTENFVDYVDSFSDEIFLARLPVMIQKIIIKSLPKKIKLNNRALKHKSIQFAAKKLGYKEKISNIFDMLKSHKYLVNDFPVFYDTEAFSEDVIFTGPLYSIIGKGKIDDERILEIIDSKNNRKKIFCTLGSSGNKSDLLEIIRFFNEVEGQNWSGIILSPEAICPIDEALNLLNNKNVYITDKFVPAKEINKKVDLVICHGGQGTLQTAITSGTPLVGVATQPEQKINLEHLEKFGMAIRLPKWKWKSKYIRNAVIKIISNEKYHKKALELKRISEQLNTKEIIAKQIWTEIKNYS